MVGLAVRLRGTKISDAVTSNRSRCALGEWECARTTTPKSLCEKGPKYCAINYARRNARRASGGGNLTYLHGECGQECEPGASGAPSSGK